MLWVVVDCNVARRALAEVSFVALCFPWCVAFVEVFGLTLLCPTCILLRFLASPSSYSRMGKAFSFGFLVSFRTSASTAAAPAFAGAAAGELLLVFFRLVLLFL